MKRIITILLSAGLMLFAGCALQDPQQTAAPSAPAQVQEFEKVEKSVFFELYDMVELLAMRGDVEQKLGVEGEDVTTGELDKKYSSVLYKKGNYGVKVEYEGDRVRGKSLYFENIAQLSQYNSVLVVYEQMEQIETGQDYETVVEYLGGEGTQISTFLDTATGTADGGLYCWANADSSCLIVQFNADMTVYNAQFINAK